MIGCNKSEQLSIKNIYLSTWISQSPKTILLFTIFRKLVSLNACRSLETIRSVVISEEIVVLRL